MKVRSKTFAGIAVMASVALAVTACSSSDPFDEGESTDGGDGIVVGSAAFPENEIIMQIYAQALEAQGVSVETKPNIGQRDVYISALDDGSIDVIPEYTGNLLQFFDDSSTAASSDDVYEALSDVADGKGYEVLDQAEAEDKDSYNVTREYAEAHDVSSLADLEGESVTVGANSEFAERPYGIPGLKDVYGIDATLKPISDSSGPLTVKALVDGDVDMADIFSTTPAIADNDFVTLDDPENLIIAQNVVPLIRPDKASDAVVETLNAVSANLTTEDLIAMNGLSSGDEKLSPEKIAAQWLGENDLD